jgi:saccharopine dehydrogenase-like NADP-dependent oxidoreductase
MRVLILGGYGAVGARIAAKFRADGDTAVVAGRDPARADRVIDLRAADTGSLTAALSDVDVVVNAAGTEDPALVELVTRHGAAFVDITATTRYIAALERLDPPRPVMLSVGLAPGLTNLVAAAVREASPGPIDLAVVLGAGERHGAAGVAWSYGLLGRRFRDPATGALVRNYTRPRRFDLPGLGRRRLYRVDFSDQHTLTRDLDVPVRTYFGLDSVAATTALATLTWIPGGSRAPQGLHLPGTDRWLVLARGGDGTVRWADGQLQSQATAVLAVAAARVVTQLPAGVHHLHHALNLADVSTDHGIHLAAQP